MALNLKKLRFLEEKVGFCKPVAGKVVFCKILPLQNMFQQKFNEYNLFQKS